MKGVERIAGTLQEGSLYVLLLLLPFSNAAIEITFGLMLVGWLTERFSRQARTQNVWANPLQRPLLATLVAYLAVCAASIAVSNFPEKSVSALFYKWGEYLLMFVVTADIAGRRAHVLSRSVTVLFASSLLVVFEAVAQEVTGRGPLRGFPLSYYGRMTGPYRDPINLATYLMVMVPVALAAAMTWRSKWRWLLWGWVLLFVGCLVRAEALGAWVGLGSGLLVAAFADRTVRVRVLAVLSVSILTWGVYLQRLGHLREIFSATDIGRVDRWAMWQAAIGMIKDRPILGHGLNTFMANYLTYWVGGERQPRYAHNCYLQVAAETGLVGLIAFLGLLGCLGARLAAGLRNIQAAERPLLLGFTAGLVAFLVQAGLDTNFYSVRQATLFWVFAGLTLGFSERLSHTAARGA